MISLDQLREEHFKKTCCLTSSTALLAEPPSPLALALTFLIFSKDAKAINTRHNFKQ